MDEGKRYNLERCWARVASRKKDRSARRDEGRYGGVSRIPEGNRSNLLATRKMQRADGQTDR
jgi:hypothetical protein